MTNKILFPNERIVRLNDSNGNPFTTSNKLPISISDNITIDDTTPIDVNITNASLLITASALDIRPLVYTTDTINVNTVVDAVTITKPISTGTAWDGLSTTGSNGDSSGFQPNGPTLSIFGDVDGATTISVWFSNDGSNFYQDVNSFITSGAGDVSLTITTAAQYVRLRSSNDITATIYFSSR